MDNTANQVEPYKENVNLYDQQAREMFWHAPEAVFGMCFEYLKPGQRVLDVGIGTGLGAMLYARAGLEVHGLDADQEMLTACREKGFACKLKQADVRQHPWPYPDSLFDNVVISGLLHFFNSLADIFSEACRVLKPNGILALTVMAPNLVLTSDGVQDLPDYTSYTSPEGVPFYAHSAKYVRGLLEENELRILKRMHFVVHAGEEYKEGMRFVAYAARK